MADEHVKLFISYSWTSSERIEWVVNLASELRTAGVDVVLDKWDLKEGNDAFAFMEQMVTDDDVTKVIMVCDREYAEKSDTRRGGVGAEAQILTPEIYGKVDQNKFVAIIAETDDDGRPYVPQYFKGRIYIDLSDEEIYATNFDQLIRWIYDKPAFVKPKLGTMPAHLEGDDAPSLGTSVLYRRAVASVRNKREDADGAIADYLDEVIKNFEEFRMEVDRDEPLDDQVLKSIEYFIPYRNELMEVFLAIAQFRDTEDSRQTLHRFFEQLIPYREHKYLDGVQYISDEDNFKFIIHELFIYLVAALLKFECFDFVGHMLSQKYYNSITGEMDHFAEFRGYLESLQERNKRVGNRRWSLHAEFLRERTANSGVIIEQLIQADLVIYARECLDIINTGKVRQWWPETLMFAPEHSGPTEIFARAVSAKYFEKIRLAFGADEPEELKQIGAQIQIGEIKPPKWEFQIAPIANLMNLENLASTL